MKRRRFVLLSLLAVCALCAASGRCATIYVKWDSPYDGPGNDWEHAFHKVRAGLNAAAGGSQVWVASGTYVERITLKLGVGLYGGFAGTETTREQRNWSANATILDGSQGGSVVSASYLGCGTARMDGFTIRNGKADYGGGMYCEYSSPAIANNTITSNRAERNGGGIYCYNSSSTIANNTITSNSASYYGGGIYCSGSPTIANNTITANSASTGGGIYCDSSSPTIANNTITANSAYYGGGICCYSGSSTIANNIVAFNSSGIYRSGGSPSLRYNCVYNPGGSNYVAVSPGVGDIQVDPRLAYGQVHIQPDSPCVDAGDDSAVGSGWLDMDGQARIQGVHVDIGVDESDGTVWTFTPRVVRVSPTGDDGNDGSSWSLAKRTVQAALDAASLLGGEVWVKAGTYEEQITLRPYAYLYGGFAGTETARCERNWAVNKSIINGGGSGWIVSVRAGYTFSSIDGSP